MLPRTFALRAAVAIAALAAPAARADLLEVTYSLGAELPEFRTTTPGAPIPSRNLVVPQHDPNLGIRLLSARVDLTQEIRSTIYVEPTGRAIITATSGVFEDGTPVFPHVRSRPIGSAAALDFLAGGRSTVLQNDDGSLVTVVWDGEQGRYTVTPDPAQFDAEQNLWSVARSETFVSQTFTDPQDLQRFLMGSPDLIYQVNGEGRSFYSTSTGSGTAIVQTFLAARLTVTYTYLIPEPSTIGLFATGGMMVAWAARRRKRPAA